MANDRSPIDAMVGQQPEDLVRRVHPDGEQDEAAQEASRSGGNAKLPANISPFKLGSK